MFIKKEVSILVVFLNPRKYPNSKLRGLIHINSNYFILKKIISKQSYFNKKKKVNKSLTDFIGLINLFLNLNFLLGLHD
jgi:hypothetical protein